MSAMEFNVDTLCAMRRQEKSGHYSVKDYLHQEDDVMRDDDFNLPLHLAIDADCRAKMASWCYQIVDFCKFNRSTVVIALSYLDRYLSSADAVHHGALSCTNTFQLAAMTCLYTAIKIHEAEAMSPQILSTLSRGAYSVEEIENMEANILKALEWRMNPPTATAFVHHFLDCFPLESETRDALWELAQFQLDLASRQYPFVGVPASTMAAAAALNAMECCCMEDTTSFQKLLSQLDIQTSSQLRSALYETLAEQDAVPTSPTHDKTNQAAVHSVRRTSFEYSPRCVSG